jgi:hypothetical protein
MNFDWNSFNGGFNFDENELRKSVLTATMTSYLNNNCVYPEAKKRAIWDTELKFGVTQGKTNHLPNKEKVAVLDYLVGRFIDHNEYWKEHNEL